MIDDRAHELVRKLLVGRVFSVVRNCNGWDFQFDDLWLSTHEISFPEEKQLLELLGKHMPDMLKAVDKEYVAQGALVCRRLRIPVSDVEILEDASLKITFKDGLEMICLTGTPYVDWHWSISSDQEGPFGEGCIVTSIADGHAEILGEIKENP